MAFADLVHDVWNFDEDMDAADRMVVQIERIAEAYGVEIYEDPETDGPSDELMDAQTDLINAFGQFLEKMIPVVEAARRNNENGGRG